MSQKPRIASLFYREASGKLKYDVQCPCGHIIPDCHDLIVANVPSNLLDEVNAEIEALKTKLNGIRKNIKEMVREEDIRRLAAACESCNLCMVCAGDHRRYESWPPGTGQCFCTLEKKGKPLRDEPCKLCGDHDLQLRNFKRAWRQTLAKQSNTGRKLNQAIAKRRNLFRDHSINSPIIQE